MSSERENIILPPQSLKKNNSLEIKTQPKKIEVRKKIAVAKGGKPHPNQRGENHPNWKGGVTPKNEKIRKALEYKLWRKAIFVRDNWICQKCKIKGGKLVAHHINNFASYPNLQTSIENGATLCKKCHAEFHKIYGTKNNTRKNFEEFLNIFSYNQKTEIRRPLEIYSSTKT